MAQPKALLDTGTLSALMRAYPVVVQGSRLPGRARQREAPAARHDRARGSRSGGVMFDRREARRAAVMDPRNVTR